MKVKHLRKMPNLLAEAFMPYQPQDYNGIVGTWHYPQGYDSLSVEFFHLPQKKVATDRLIGFSDSTNPLGKALLRNIETALAVASSVGTDPLDPSQILTACLINRLPVASGEKSDEITLAFQPISRGKIIDFWDLVYEFCAGRPHIVRLQHPEGQSEKSSITKERRTA